MKTSETVYLVGAGVNRCLINENGLPPPLDADFFQLLATQGEGLQGEPIPKDTFLPHYRLRANGEVPPLEEASDRGSIYWAYDFIRRYWHKTPRDLTKSSFSLEELLTSLQLKREDASRLKNNAELLEYFFCELVVEHRLLDYLKKFDENAKTNASMSKFGEIIFREKSTVITVNYDTIVETVIAQASKNSTNPRASAWNAKDSYRYKFREPGSPNQPYKSVRPLILKLHGSLNWVSVTEIANNHVRLNSLIFYDKSFTDYLKLSPQGLLTPLIVPMILYKDRYYRHPAIKAVWNNAKKELSACKNLVVVGYSFPPTDFHIKKLLLDGLYDRGIEKLTIVNPDTSVVQRIKDVTNFQKPVLVCRDLEEYLSSTK